MHFSSKDPTPKRQFRATMEEQPEDHEPVRSVLNDLAQQPPGHLIVQHELSNSALLQDPAAQMRRRRTDKKTNLTKKTKLNYEQKLIRKFHSTKPRMSSKSPGSFAIVSQGRFDLSKSIKEASPEYNGMIAEFPNLYHNLESGAGALNRTADMEMMSKQYHYFPPTVGSQPQT